jgi:hypothetical protein
MAVLGQERSYEPVTVEDLRRLAGFVSTAHAEMSGLRSDLKGQLVAACLAQGSALHFVDGAHGVKDFDLWLFYRPENLQRRMRTRGRCRVYDFGPSVFGRNPDDDSESFRGRRVDVLCRELPARAPAEPGAAVLAWLGGTAESARQLRKRPVVMLWPRQQLGQVIWDPTRDRLLQGTMRDLRDPQPVERLNSPRSIDVPDVNRDVPISPDAIEAGLDEAGSWQGSSLGSETGVVWRLRAWDDTDLEAIWLRDHVISMSADEVGDVTVWPGSEPLKMKLIQALPERSPRAIGGFVRYWRYFRLEMVPGDLVLVPFSARRVGLARVLGDYGYDPTQSDARLRHRRSVEWRSTLNRTDLPENLLRVVNAPGTICRVRSQGADDGIR